MSYLFKRVGVFVGHTRADDTAWCSDSYGLNVPSLIWGTSWYPLLCVVRGIYTELIVFESEFVIVII